MYIMYTSHFGESLHLDTVSACSFKDCSNSHGSGHVHPELISPNKEILLLNSIFLRDERGFLALLT